MGRFTSPGISLKPRCGSEPPSCSDPTWRYRRASGNCGYCRARLLQGEIHYPNGQPLGLSPAEAAEGFVLLCQARARSNVLIETFAVTTPEQALIKRLPARIERVVPLSHDVMGLYLKLPAAEVFAFEAGQYIDIMLPGEDGLSLCRSIRDHALEGKEIARTGTRRRQTRRERHLGPQGPGVLLCGQGHQRAPRG